MTDVDDIFASADGFDAVMEVTRSMPSKDAAKAAKTASLGPHRSGRTTPGPTFTLAGRAASSPCHCVSGRGDDVDEEPLVIASHRATTCPSFECGSSDEAAEITTLR